MEKKINYLKRDYSSVRDELINFSKTYYPELSNSFDDSSVGSWMIDLMAAVGDELAYATDRVFQETQLNSANMKSSLFNIARNNNVKIPNKKASLVEVELSCTLPLSGSSSLSMPNWDLAPIVKRDTIISNGTYYFELEEDVNFAEQFNSDGYSNRTFTPITSNNGNVTGYKVSKSVLAYGGRSKIYSRIISEEELQPFMEILLPEQNILGIESIIFKESNTVSETPDNTEFYIEEECYKFTNEDINTYRFFEVDSLSDQYRFGCKANVTDDNVVKNKYYPNMYEDYTETTSGSTRTTRIYQGKWHGLTQKFITETTDNGYTKIIFGAGSIEAEVPSAASSYAQNMMCNILNNPMMGVLPKAGWTMYILYRVGGGVDTNLAVGAINGITFKDTTFASYAAYQSYEQQDRTNVIASLGVTNLTVSLGGKDAPSETEIKYLIKYNNAAQDRCVTIKDYRSRILMMPPKYGCPFRNNVIEENNKIVVSMLNIDPDGKLTTYLPSALSDNIIEYMSHYKTLGDYLEMKSGRIFNLGFMIEVFIDKNYTTSTVATNIINTIKDYMDINKHEMGEEIFIGDLEKELNKLDGVLALIDVKVYSLYSNDENSPYHGKSTLPEYTVNTNCDTCTTDTFKIVNGVASRIDIDAIDSLLTLDYDSMFEILNPTNDIQLKIKLK